MNKRIVALATAALTLASVSASLAADKMMGGKMAPGAMMHKGKPMMGAKMTGGVYVCKMCKAAYSPAQAKKMGYKDSMGHKLVKMSKAPAGYSMGGMMHGGMMHGGMMHGGMHKM